MTARTLEQTARRPSAPIDVLANRMAVRLNANGLNASLPKRSIPDNNSILTAPHSQNKFSGNGHGVRRVRPWSREKEERTAQAAKDSHTRGVEAGRRDIGPAGTAKEM